MSENEVDAEICGLGEIPNKDKKIEDKKSQFVKLVLKEYKRNYHIISDEK